MDSPKPWKILNSQDILSIGFVRLRKEQCELPSGIVMPGYYIMAFKNWANIIPITPDGKIVFVEQYRHATGEVTLEIPGGSWDEEKGEGSEEAALRELREESGYSGRVIAAKKHRPNPAIQSNWMHTFLAVDCKIVGEPMPDPYEDLRVHALTWSEVQNKIASGEINHSIVLASLFCLLPEVQSALSSIK
ncbi:MAG: NUDIX hydrolase [Pseudobdellovibrionaceae bacterium]